MSFFAEDSSQASELSRPISAQPIKTLLVEGCCKVQVLLERGAAGVRA